MCGCVSSKCDDGAQRRESPRPSLARQAEAQPAALQLVQVSPDDSLLRANEAAGRQLIGMGDSPIALVAVADCAREGGCSILRDMLNSAGITPACSNQTSSGIWLWPEPLKVSGVQHKLVSEQKHCYLMLLQLHQNFIQTAAVA